MERKQYVEAGSDVHARMVRLSFEVMRVTSRLNAGYHEPEEIRDLFAELTGSDIDPSFGLFPPFYTDCGKNIHIGKNVFINSGCHFQDQGGIYIGDGVLIGHNVTLATLNHDQNPERRCNLEPAPLYIGDHVWSGSNVTVTPGVRIGRGSIVAVGAVVTKDVGENVIVGGVSERLIRPVWIE